MEANELQDDQLQQIAALLNQKVISSELNQSNELLSALPIDSEARVYIHNLSKGSSSQLIPSLTNELPDGFQTAVTRQKIWRVFVKTLANKERVALAQDTELRNEIAIDGALRTLLPTVILIPVLIVVINILIRRTFVPIEELAHRMDQRTDNELGQVPTDGIPIEVRPFVGAINRLLARVTQSVETQKRFIADAAHELRTPVTALNLQTKILISQFPEHEALQNLSKGLARIQHLVTQLLALAKQDVGLSLIEPNTQFYLNDVALNCVEQLVNLAMEKEIDLGFERNDLIEMQSLEPTVHSIIFNLIDNAIKYTPNQGIINISVYDDTDGFAYVQIDDSGQGIDPDQYDKVLKRFYRVHHHLEVGSGLGLSIVDKATQRLGGTLTLSRSLDLGGLSVLVKLPKKLEHHA
mgnify:CR=1 FL=1